MPGGQLADLFEHRVPVEQFATIGLFAATANFSAQLLESGFPRLLALFEQTEALADHFARRLVAAGGNPRLHELLNLGRERDVQAGYLQACHTCAGVSTCGIAGARQSSSGGISYFFERFDYLRILRLPVMMAARDRRMATLTPVLPSEADALLAKESSRVLASHLPETDAVLLRVVGNRPEETVRVPVSAVRLLVHILAEMAKGNAVTVIPVHAELTTQEAADMLNISRPSLIQLLDEGKIEYRRVGTHRRVRFKALMAYKRKLHADRKAALAELAACDQEIGI